MEPEILGLPGVGVVQDHPLHVVTLLGIGPGTSKSLVFGVQCGG